jgi:hypothetical protein
MKSWGSNNKNNKPKYGYGIWPNKANVPFLSDLINEKDATSNERYCEVANAYDDLHNVCTGLHISFGIQGWRSRYVKNKLPIPHQI